MTTVLRHLPAPKPEKLRVLMLGASAEGDLRVGREQKRIRAAVEAGDIPLAPASGRQRLAARWRWAGEHLTTLPGIAELCRRALHHFGWPSELPLYPAFAET